MTKIEFFGSIGFCGPNLRWRHKQTNFLQIFDILQSLIVPRRAKDLTASCDTQKRPKKGREWVKECLDAAPPFSLLGYSSGGPGICTKIQSEMWMCGDFFPVFFQCLQLVLLFSILEGAAAFIVGQTHIRVYCPPINSIAVKIVEKPLERLPDRL